MDFLSCTIDISLILGGRWWGEQKGLVKGVAPESVQSLDLHDPRLIRYTRALGPLMLRIGGTEADRVRYTLGKKARASWEHRLPTWTALDKGPAEKDQLIDESFYKITKKTWQAIADFCQVTNTQLLFTLSAGPGDRDSKGAWIPDNALRLVAYTLKKSIPVAAWELGNEVNGFPFFHGLRHRVRAGQYARDFFRFGQLIGRVHPGARLVGPASAFWPTIGEPFPILKYLCRSPGAAYLSAVSWHYYPQQSSMGGFRLRKATKFGMTRPDRLDEVARWNREVKKDLTRLPETENWVTETAHALYGGEPGLSDTFVSTLWWLDELGLLAREGVQKVFRQSLVGARYGLLDQDTFGPRPDYYASFLWKKLMGPQVYDRPTFPDGQGLPKSLRIYRHKNQRTTTELLIHLDREKPYSLGPFKGGPKTAVRIVLQGEGGFDGSRLLINGIPADEDLVFKWEKKKTRAKYTLDETQFDRFEVPPLSATFLVFST